MTGPETGLVTGPAARLVRRRATRPCGTRAEAAFSPCGAYRYALTLTWSPAGSRVTWIMLNPSTADAARNDPTIERCERRSRALGHGAMRAVNLFALRATRPADMKRAADPVGPRGDAALAAALRWADAVICAWGVHGHHAGRDREVLARVRHPLVLGLTAAGHPRHPLYVPYAAAPAPWLDAPAPAA